MRLFILTLVIISTTSGPAAAVGRSTVTNDDIRDAILQVVNVVRATEDKLERHEYRERVLGEQLKKGLISIDKRVKLLEPFKGTINRLDQRLAAVETILMQKDERERIQLQKTFDAVEDIQKNLPIIVDKLKSDIIEKLSDLKPATPPPPPPSITKEDLEKVQKDLASKIEKVTETIKSMEQDLNHMKDENNNIRELNNKSSENLDKVKRQLSSSEQLLEKYENKLAEYNNRIPPVIPDNYKDQKDWHPSFLQALEIQKNNVEQVLSDVKAITTKVNRLPDKTDLETLQNATLGSVQTLKDPQSLSQISDDIAAKHRNVTKSIDAIAANVDSLTQKFAASSQNIRAEIENLGKVEQVMVQTADSVLDTKRRVEYGVHQIIAEMQQLIKASSKDVNAAISERFDTFEMSVLDEETGALANLTAKIGQEIDQVWRQIGIMHQQMSASTDTLNRLQNQTDQYVSGSLNVMDNMKGKVGTITSRITEVDENLNYLLGKLSLVTQEFNQIKSGLGKALDEMRSTYKTVREKINQGPGPHKIEDSTSK
ncbi:putative leucine-rich repeat-containing protein DDB_G0290503 [Zophobas morio]|uniref:putative leucine-rich repeat-containing protein DDB_G0290503 n=1 Tax=Zophobas morio TaxID=2755281 RepID=UPI003082E6CC